jgi:hypothetical protein
MFVLCFTNTCDLSAPALIARISLHSRLSFHSFLSPPRYSNRLALLVENIENGVYPLRVHGGTGVKRFIVPPAAKPTDIFAQKGKGGKGAGGKEKQSALIKHVIANAQRAGRALRKVRKEEERRRESPPPCGVHGGGSLECGKREKRDDGWGG